MNRFYVFFLFLFFYGRALVWAEEAQTRGIVWDGWNWTGTALGKAEFVFPLEIWDDDQNNGFEWPIDLCASGPRLFELDS